MLMQWLARGSPKKSNGGGGGGGGARSHSHGGKSKSKDREKEKDSGAIGGAKILSFRKIKVNLNGGNSSFKKDSSKEKSAAGVTRSQSFSTALPLPEPGFELNPARSGSPHASFWHPLPSPDQFFHRNDGWDSTTSSLASDEHDPAAAAAVAAAATTSDKDSCNPSAVACANGQIEAAAKCNNNPRNQQQNQNQNQRQQQGLPISGKRGFPAKQLQIPANRTLGSATDSSLSSPSSPMRAFDPNGPGIWGLRQHHDVVAAFGSGNCSSPGSGTNSTGGDIIGHPFRGSSDRSPVPSPKLRSPGPSSRAQSTAVSPRHPRAGGIGTDSPKECRHGGHPLPVPLPLPLPPRSPTSVCTPFSNMASPSPRSPGSRDNPASPGHRWKKGKLLGRGTFGHVYVGFNSESGEMCAMKEVTLFADDPKSKESVKQLAQEVAMLGHLRHPNIVQYYGCEMVDDTLYIYLEYVSGGSIHKLLQEYGQLGEPAIRSYTQQILSGLAYLHNKNTVHRDIKGANILVDPNGHVKLADFGMAKHISTNSCPLSFKGSPHWMAPEVLKNSNGYDLAVDIWSLGCTIIEMATARPPWSQYEGVAAMFKIGNTKELPEFPPNLSEEGKNFLKLCLQRDPTNRPSAARLLDHPFVKNATLVRIDNNLENADILSCAESTRSSNGMQHPGHARFLSAVDMDYCATPNSRGWPNHQILSDQLYAQRNRSLPLSPNGSPLIQPRSPFHRYGGMSSSPMSTPLASSGCSTPQTGGHDAMPFQANGFTRPSIFVQDNVGNIPKYLLGPNPSFPGLSFDPNPDNHGTPPTFRTTEGSPKLQKVAAAETETLGRAFGGMFMNERGQSPRLYNASMALAEHVSQQFFKSPTHVAGEYRAMSTPQVHRTNNEFY